ncbi:MAG: helix-turn-helix transcriptional regulator [Candidatus Aminicenantes bacterium]|nr:helix-turn-helix transcriptional regulator [Candidatus Aminicenantes bacterium]
MSSKTLIAAAAKPVILSILAGGESYGYQIIKRVRQTSGGTLEWSSSLLYPVLHRLEKEKLIQSRWKLSPKGRMRRTYRITEKGRTELSEEKERWLSVHYILLEFWKTAEA